MAGNPADHRTGEQERQGWGIVGIIAFSAPNRAELLHELKRLHNLGLSGCRFFRNRV
jgi:hypothetical protein